MPKPKLTQNEKIVRDFAIGELTHAFKRGFEERGRSPYADPDAPITVAWLHGRRCRESLRQMRKPATKRKK